MTASPLRFFFTVCRPSATVWLVASSVLAYGGYVGWLSADSFGQVLAITVFLQAFAASTGWRTPLRCGQFDPLLVTAARTWRVAAAHWFVSVAPGLAVWMALGVMQFVFRPSTVPLAARPSLLVLFVYVSTVVWALSTWVGRFGGALLWLTALFCLNVTGSLAWFRVAFIPDPSTLADTGRTLVATLVVPMVLAIEPSAVGLNLLLLVCAATVAVWLAGAAAIRAFDAVLVRP